MSPNFNHLSWLYDLAVISFVLHWLTTCLLYLGAKTGYRLRREFRNLEMHMQPNLHIHRGLSREGYI